MNRDQIANKAHKLLSQYGIGSNEPDYLFLRDNIIAAKEMGRTWKQITQWLEEILN